MDDRLEPVEIEMVRPKDDPSQLWIREVSKEGEPKNDWQINIIHKDYQYLMDEDRHDELPPYAMEEIVIVSSDGVVIKAREQHPNFDPAKIANCPLRKS